MKNKLAKDGKRLTSYVGKNAEPSCSTWHQAAPMYLPSTSYTGESIKRWSCGRWISRRSIVDNCSCHDWTTAISMTKQLQLPSLDNCSYHDWTTVVAMPGQLQLPFPGQLEFPCLDNCSCHAWTDYSCHALTNYYHDFRLLRWRYPSKRLMASFIDCR